MQLSRRHLLTVLAASSAGMALARPARAQDAGSPWHVVYLGTHTREEAEELRDVLGTHLGAEVASSLRIAQRDEDWVVVYDRSSVRDPYDPAVAAAVATRHASLLGRALELEGPVAEAVPADALSTTWDVRYGPPSDPRTLKDRFDVVARVLGAGVTKDLAIVEQPGGVAWLVWQRRGDAARTSEIARHHSALLRKEGLEAVAVPSPTGAATDDASTRPHPELPPIPSEAAVVALEQAEPEVPAVPSRSPIVPLGALPSIPEDDAESAAADSDTDAALALDTALPEPQASDDALQDSDSDSDAIGDTALADTGLDGQGGDEVDAVPIDDPVLALPLEEAIEGFVKRWRAEGRLEPIERTAWIVHDLARDETVADINADVPMQAASMIKPYVAIAFFQLVADGQLSYGPRSREQMERMIQRSDNDATNWLLRWVGGPSAAQRVLRRHFPGFTQSLRLVEYIPADGRTYANRASVRDHMRLLRAVWHDEVPHARELKRVLNLPGADRLFHRVPVIPAGTAVYNKTGTTAMCCGDMGVLVARSDGERSFPYIVVGVIERSSRAEAFTRWVRGRADLIRGVSGLTYRWLAARNQLV